MILQKLCGTDVPNCSISQVSLVVLIVGHHVSSFAVIAFIEQNEVGVGGGGDVDGYDIFEEETGVSCVEVGDGEVYWSFGQVYLEVDVEAVDVFGEQQGFDGSLVVEVGDEGLEVVVGGVLLGDDGGQSETLLGDVESPLSVI